MNMLPPGPPGRVELLDQLAHPRDAARVVGTHEDRVGARIGDDGDPLLGVGRRAGGRRGRGVGDEPVQERHEVDRRRVAERNDDRLAARRLVERRDHTVEPLHVVRVVGDDQCVAVGVRGDRVVGRDQRTQHVDELRRGLVTQRDHLRHEPVAAAGQGPGRDGSALLLGVGLRDDLDDTAFALDRGESLHAQRG